MPPKRTWSQTNDVSAALVSPVSKVQLIEAINDGSALAISRKVKACASCRKQKIKCIMDDSGPPCKRCAERSLSCVLNKSLQTLIEERSQWKDSFVGDLGNIHASLQQALTRLSLPPLPPLQSGVLEYNHTLQQQDPVDIDDVAPSYDNSPRISPKDEGLPHAPIDSLYEITRLSALRSTITTEEQNSMIRPDNNSPIRDFISRGLVPVQDAERLFQFFLGRIDHFMYTIGSGGLRDLSHLRRRSPILTACILTVGALHDPDSNTMYTVCNREFRRLMSDSMFDRCLDLDSMRALCVATYWLHDVSWMICGYATRRAMEVNLHDNFQQVLSNNSEEAMNHVRIRYVLYICDRHLSVLYGRPAIVRHDTSIASWEKLMSSSVFTESDKRLVSQMALLIIMSHACELFGPNIGEPFPNAFAPKLMNFSLQIDQWMGFWSMELPKTHKCIGEFPTKGANLHHHLAKLHIHSHVFRGLKGAAVPLLFQESAAMAVSAATSIIELVLIDPDIRDSLVGIPHYIHSMIAFACVFLLKIAAQYSEQYTQDTVIFDLTTRAVQQFRSTPVGKWHLVHLMAEGLEKMTARQSEQSNFPPGARYSNNTFPSGSQQVPHPPATVMLESHGESLYRDDILENVFNGGFDFSASSFLNFNTGTLDLDFTGFGF